MTTTHTQASLSKRPLFRLGQIVMTRGVAEIVAAGQLNPAQLLNRHVRGDWGDICSQDRGLNELAILGGDRIFSVYKVTPDLTVWIITEGADDQGRRAATTLLLPDEY